MNDKKTAEDHWIMKQEAEKLGQLREIRKRAHKKEEMAQLKDTHWMRCPKCGQEMVEIEYSNSSRKNTVHIDKCGGCEAITLDNGELELILEMHKGSLSKLFRI